MGELAQRRITLSLNKEGDKIVARPTAAITPEVVDMLKANKPYLIAALLESPGKKFPQAPKTADHADHADHGENRGQNPHAYAKNTDRHPTDHSPITIGRGADRRLQKASDLGLVGKWSRSYGYISLHDPVSGEWHDLQTKDAPDWVRREASKRKELYKSGNDKAYHLTSSQMQEIWEADHPSKPDLIVEDYPVENKTNG